MMEEGEKGAQASFLYAASPSLQMEAMRPSLAASVQDTRVNLLHALDDDEERVAPGGGGGGASPSCHTASGPAIFVQLPEAVRFLSLFSFPSRGRPISQFGSGVDYTICKMK